MKKLAIKAIVSIVSIAIVFVAIRLLSNNHEADDDGFVHLTIVDGSGITVFEDDIEFFEGETFFDILSRSFDLTCANASYQPDPECLYTFQGFGYQGKAILGISSDHFTIITDWYTSFLAFEQHNGETYYISTSGPSHLPFNDGDKIRISVQDPWGG
ncbi:hypothetical protein [Peloplasma aerotolerans]|jgi:hypothetical protein|uniref:DUF4430 domain-containing protein n=1 Tax=Peloplasma aerotolerans TaxID=3044389 RepID=A0AAW6U615_9MOLU|nr:hypothetical protein [Mariniplasma sp. M4Ah]MDI6453347.1 hypothetical protein [Mariniplasma sp. M4Ah]MDR4968092.1 hypothetical protein [Acholeplasmataceae bacterium]